jgi:hypothetical protein
MVGLESKIVLASRIVLVLLFLALVRTLVEPLIRPVSAGELKMLLAGALVASLGCLALAILGFWGRYRWMLLVGVATLAALVIIKTVIP